MSRSPFGKPLNCGCGDALTGSGKSLTVAFYAGRIILHPAVENGVVVLTDHNAALVAAS